MGREVQTQYKSSLFSLLLFAAMEFDLENPWTSFEEHQSDTVPALFANESDHMPSHYFSHGLKSNDFRVSVRREAIALIFQAQFYCNFDSIIPCLAISYVDRFISMQEIWNEGSSWITRLLAISCLSLAAKMKNTGLSISDLQRDEGFVCDSQSIRRMELLILTTLNWKMRSITPFSFLYFFISLFHLEDPPLIQDLRDRASEILFRSHYEIKISEYKPSIIAASALLCASQELFPLQFPRFRAAIASCEYVNKEKLLNCSILMEEMGMDRCKSMFDSVCNSTTPISVLDRLCTTSERENATTNTLMISSHRATPPDGGKSIAAAAIVRFRSLSSSNVMIHSFKEMDHQNGVEAPIANSKKINGSQPSSLNHFS